MMEEASPMASEEVPFPDPADDAKVESFVKSAACKRRGSVSAAPVCHDRLKDWKAPVHAKSPEQVVRILETIRVSSALQVLFGHLTSSALDLVVGAMFQRDVRAGEVIIEQGADGDYFYIVDTGVYDIFVRRQAESAPQKVLTASAGMSFGELALMYNVPRAATVICAQAGQLWCLDRDCFQMMLATAENTKMSEYESFLSKVDVLSALNKYELQRLSDLLTPECFAAGEVIVKQGDEGDTVFFLYEGECKAYMDGPRGEVEVKHYTRHGEYFGEIALITDERRRATVRASCSSCVVLSLRREEADLSVGCIRERLREQIGRYPQYEAFLKRS